MKNDFGYIVGTSMVLILGTVLFCGKAAWADDDTSDAKAQTVVAATPQVVWRAVHEERAHDPDLIYSHVVSKKGDTVTLQQKYAAVPFLGPISNITKEHETPLKEIDYSLVKSDKLKRMDGRWTFQPLDGGKETLVQLTSTVNLKKPFFRHLVQHITQQKLDRRIASVKKLAEHEQSLVAASNGKEALERQHG